MLPAYGRLARAHQPGRPSRKHRRMSCSGGDDVADARPPPLARTGHDPAPDGAASGVSDHAALGHEAQGCAGGGRLRSTMKLHGLVELGRSGRAA